MVFIPELIHKPMIVTILQPPVNVQLLPCPNSPTPWGPLTHSSLNEVHNVCIILDLMDMQIGKEWPGLLAFNSHDEVDKA